MVALEAGSPQAVPFTLATTVPFASRGSRVTTGSVGSPIPGGATAEQIHTISRRFNCETSMVSSRITIPPPQTVQESLGPIKVKLLPNASGQMNPA